MSYNINKALYKNFFFWLLSIVILIVAVELCCKMLWYNYVSKAPSSGVIMVKKAIGDDLNELQQLVSNPYSLYWNNPDYRDEFGNQYDKNGYRSVEYDGKNKLKILALGGSTTNMYPFIKDRDNIWTSIISKKLDSMGISNHVFNAGLPSGTSAELLTHYFLKGRYLEPDLIIIHTGGNDVTSLLFSNYKTDYSHLRKSNNGYLEPRPGESFLLSKSYFLRNFYHVWLRGKGIYSPKPYSHSQINRIEALKRIKENESAAFKGNIESIVQHAISQGSKILLIPFIQANKSNLTRNRPDLDGLEKALIIGLKKHSDIMKKISIDYDQKFLQLDTSKIPQNWFLDNCHLNEKGEYEKAVQIFNEIRDNLKDYGFTQ